MKKEKKNKLFFPKVLIEIKPSKIIKGEIGLFATRDLKKMTLIAESKKIGKEKLIKWSDFSKIDKITQDKIMDYCLGTPDGFYSIDDLNYLSTPWNMNHSCDGNVGFNEKGDFITIRGVKRGEELCWDYGLAESNPNFKMICKCGSKKCRKIITGNDWKRLILDKDKKKFVLKELLNN